MADFQEDNFEQKLLGLKDTQESIQSLSLWCLKHSQQHKKIVSCWLHVLKKVKVEQRLTLFYLANDVIQYSKRKNFPFVESWATALQKATPLVRDDKVKHKILRLFKIWDERSVYDETFLADLSGLLTAHTKKSSNQLSAAELVQEFQPSNLFAKIRKCKALEEDTDLKLKIVKECSIPVSDPDALQVVVKDRRNGDDLMQDIEDGIVKLEAYTKALGLEIKERIDVISVLEISEQFYETQRGEAKVVCNAYRNFGNRIKTLKRKLEELLPTLPSPVPSPDIDAPSPSSGSDIDIPEDTKTVCYDSEKSFIGTDFVTAMNHASENQNQLLRNASQTYELSDMNSLMYNSSTTNNYDDYAHQRHMNAAPIGYYKSNSHIELESPASPVERSMVDNSFTYHSEGNPIEVISSTISDNHSSFNASGFLQNIMAANNVTMSTPTPVSSCSGKIPGLESPTDNARDVFCFMEAKAKTPEESGPVMWGDKPLTKYQSWPSPDITWTNSQETPVSPPAFEKESFSTPVEYVDANHPVVDANGHYMFPCEPPPAPLLHRHHEEPPRQHHIDIDQRLLNHAPPQASDPIATIPLPKLDVDDRHQPMPVPNRNLISLTNSPSSSANEPWKAPAGDADYRGGRVPMPPSPPPALATMKMPQDNIESVDMELSDDEAESKGEERATPRHRRASVKEEETPSKGAQVAAAAGADAKSGQDAQMLMPPPNPWDMMNMHPQAAGQTRPNANSMSELDFNKMMSGFTKPPPNLEPPPGGRPPPPPDFPHFSIPPLPGSQPPFGGDMRFPRPLMSIPPPPPPAIPEAAPAFHPRPDFGQPPPPPPNHMQRPPNFRPPFGFMPNPMFANNGPRGAQVPTTPTKDFPPPQQQQQQQYGHGAEAPGDTNNQGYGSNIEPLIKTRQFDKPADGSTSTDEGLGALFDRAHEFAATKPTRSNLKEISLSDVLERSISRSKNEETKQEAETDPAAANDAGDSAIDHDLFSSVDDIDANGGNVGGKDDGADDLYNNIDESQADPPESVTTTAKKGVDEALAAAVLAAVSSSLAAAATPVAKTPPGNFKFPQDNSFAAYESEEGQKGDDSAAGDHQTPVKQKTPFQAVMPKVAKPLMAPPPNFMEDDERCPWPLMPVIDLSNDGNEPNAFDDGGGGGYHQQFQQHPNNAERTNGSPAGFLRQPGKNEFRPRFFGSGDRRFPSPGQSRGGDMRGRGRFSSPRGDFRPRGGYQNQMRMPRTPGQFQPRGPGGPNFQNSPRMFKGPRGNRPFRRGW